MRKSVRPSLNLEVYADDVFGMDHEEIRLLRGMLGKLVFQPFDELVGRRFHADGLDAADLLPLIGLEGELETESRFIRGAFLKYGFVQLRFRLTRRPSQVHPASAKVLSSVLRDEELDRSKGDAETREVRIGFIEDLCDEMAAGELWMTVFADSTKPEGTLLQRAKATSVFTKVPDGLFPCEFEITDAYVTNAPGISLMRRFYW